MTKPEKAGAQLHDGLGPNQSAATSLRQWDKYKNAAGTLYLPKTDLRRIASWREALEDAQDMRFG